MFGFAGNTIAFAVGVFAGKALGDSSHVVPRSEVGFCPACLAQPVEKTATAAGVKRPLGVDFGDAGGLPDEHDAGFGVARENSPRHNGVASVVTKTTGAHGVLELY